MRLLPFIYILNQFKLEKFKSYLLLNLMQRSQKGEITEMIILSSLSKYVLNPLVLGRGGRYQKGYFNFYIYIFMF